MSTGKRLRGYIPLGAPLNWEPVLGDESPLRPIISFTTKWFNRRMGADFSEAFHTDPMVRFEQMLKMKEYIRDTFPQIAYFEEHSRDSFTQECATLSGVFGVCFVAMVYGLDVVYAPDNWPSVRPGSELTVEQIAKLKPFDLSNNRAVDHLFAQMDIIEKNWGPIDGYVNYQGILNNAFKIRGTDILMDMIDDPGLCHHLFAHISDTMERLVKLIQARQRASGFSIDSLCTSNCVVNMISSNTYEEFILPYDKQLGRAFESFGVHSCNWVVDPYIDAFAKVDNLTYIDFGFASDLPKIQNVFSGATRNVFYSPSFLTDKDHGQIETDIRKLYHELGPCELTLPDVDDFVPDEAIIWFVNKAQAVAEER